AALQAMMSWLLALELLFSHELGQLPRVDLRLEPMPLPGGRIGVEPLPQIAVWPRHGTGTRGGPSGNPAALLPLLIAAMIAAGVSLPVIMRWLQGVTAGSGGD